MNNPFFSTAYNRVLSTLVLVSLIGALVSYAYYTLKQADYLYTGPTTISVSGTGEVMAIPDIGQFSFTVIAKGVDAKGVQGEAAKKINEIIEYLKGEGVDVAKDLKTEGYTLNPSYKYEQKPCTFGTWCPPGEPTQDGFEVSQNVSVKVRNLDTSGKLLSGVGEKGAINISGLTFTIDDEAKLKADARALAIADAQKKSQQLAKELGVRVVRMTGFYEETAAYPVPYASMAGDMMKSSEMMAVPEIPRGENSTVVNVSISYQVE